VSLQKRLTLVFIAIVILPLTAAGLVVQQLVVGEVSQRSELALSPALDSAVVIYNNSTGGLRQRIEAAVGYPQFAGTLDRGRRDEGSGYLSRRLDSAKGLDFVIALDRSGKVVGSAVGRGNFEEPFEQPTLDELLEAPMGPGYVRSREWPVRIEGRGRVGSVVGGFWLDSDFLVEPQGDTDLSIAVGDAVIATTAPLEGSARVPTGTSGTFTFELQEESRGQARDLGGGNAIVASTPTGPIEAVGRRLFLSMLGLLLLALLITAALANLLARLITRPLEELAQGARAITEGRFDQEIRVRSKDEVGRLAMAFNAMTGRLRETVNELSHSRDRMHRAVRRVGETLRSTHDINQLLDSLLSTAADAVDADAAIMWRFNATRDELYPAMSIGVPQEELGRLRVGEGIIGLAAERATTIRLPRQMGGPHASPNEPNVPVVIAVPLYSKNRVIGVMSVYRLQEDDEFVAQDMDTVVFLAEQGGVAIENVLLHDEAQRLSLTDGLTGVWNRRFFRMQFNQVLATSTRFNRPFSILMMDLDHFKPINDTYGHQRGDEVLVEFTQRVDAKLREVDALARYGGEEFICLLSETDLYGALTTAEKILEAIRSEPFGSSDEQPIKLTVSIGVASHPEHGVSYKSLVEAADRALYRAKQGGRDRAYAAQTGPVPQ
jgi:two-component system, cell cycle response regulator